MRRGTGPSAAERSGVLFDGEAMRELETPDLIATYGDKPLRVVRWPLLTERPCLVVCEHGERKIEQIRALVTLCGLSCAEAVASSGAGVKDGYCQTCLSKAGRGVLR